MITLIKQEFIVQNQVYNTTKYTMMFFLFCSLSVTLINSYENIQFFGLIFCVVSIPLAFIGLSSNLIRPNIEDGTLELMLTSCSSLKIIIAKYISLCACCILSFLSVMPVIYIVYNVYIHVLLVLILTSMSMLFLCSSLIVLIASIQGYFRVNTSFIAILIMPLIIPNIVLSGVLLQNSSDFYLLYIMLGVDLIIIPPALYLSSYLIENIYNI